MSAYGDYSAQRMKRAEAAVKRAEMMRTNAYETLAVLEAQQTDGFISDELRRARKAADAAARSVERMTERRDEEKRRAEAPTLPGLA